MRELIQVGGSEEGIDPNEFTTWIDDHAQQEMTRWLLKEQALKILESSCDDDEYTNWVRWTSKSEEPKVPTPESATKGLGSSERWDNIKSRV